MQFQAQLRIIYLVLIANTTIIACEGLAGKKATPTAPAPTKVNASVDSTSETDASYSSGTSADASIESAQIPGIDKSCTGKDSCTPALVDLLIDPATPQLTGVLGKAVTWTLTAFDTKTVGGVITPLPVANAAAASSYGGGSSPAALALDTTTAAGAPSVPGILPGSQPGGSLVGRSSRHVAMILSNLPPDATLTPISLGKPIVAATISWIPTVAGNSAISVILRDFDRCLVSEPDQTVCERSTPLPAYDTPHAPIPIVITDPKPKCTAPAPSPGFLGIPNPFASAPTTPVGC
jgi:hypothetical protein